MRGFGMRLCITRGTGITGRGTATAEKRKRKTQILLFTALTAALLLGGCEALKKAEAAKKMEISSPPIERLADGIYAGSHDAGLTKVKLEATVRGGRITSIQILEHQNGKGEKAEAITEEIIREQSLEVDVVSGATISSKSILKAAENALTREKTE